MRKPSFSQALEQLLKEDTRYDEQSYYFVREALDHTIKALSKPVEGEGRHVSGQELLEGIRQYALKEFGPMTKTVLNRWGIRRCEDFGEIVFNLVQSGILGKTDKDSKQDFAGGYDFDTAFLKPFQPKIKNEASRAVSHKKE
ncbi:MAG: Minf_1886 family protein [Lentisphaerota bacterium]